LNHLRDIAPDFTPTYTDQDQKVAKLRDVIRQYPADRILLGTDNDREGEAIAYHVCRIFDLPVATTPRILFNEITQDALQRAVAHPTRIRTGLVRAQQARQVIDLWIGFKVSPLLWKHLYYSKTRALSAGRCQTPALCLIQDHAQLVAHEVPSTYYRTVGHFFPHPFTKPCTLDHRFTSADDVRAFLDASHSFSHTLHVGDKKARVRAPPVPLHTSAMLQLAHRVLNYSPKTTTQLAQLLYQGGHITYLRTDARTYAQEFLDKARVMVTETYGPTYVGNLAALQAAKAQPHEAIRVTQLAVKSVATDDPRLNTLYGLLWRHTVESCMAAAQFEVHDLTVTAPLAHQYRAEIEVPVFRGWQACVPPPRTDPEGLLLYAKTLVGQCPWTRLESTVSMERPVPHYTQAGLVQKLEDHGIGRPSTYATFVETLLEKGYVTNGDVPGTVHTCEDFSVRCGEATETKTTEKILGAEKNKLVLQPLGAQVCTFLRRHFDALFAFSYTRTMEEQLDALEAGAATYAEVCQRVHDDLEAWVRAVPAVRKGGDLVLADGNVVTFTAAGPRVRREVRREEGADVDYVPLADGVDLDTLADRTAADVAAYPQSHLGKWSNADGQTHDVRLCTGKYGPFLAWGDRRQSVPRDQVAGMTLAQAAEILNQDGKESPKTLLRQVSPHVSVRHGKYGAYLFCITPNKTRPTFVPLKSFQGDYLTCDASLLLQHAQAGKVRGKARGTAV
jgi:DNA topoisomerase-1